MTNPALFREAIAAEEAHCRRLAAIPGWRGYIEDKAKRLAREDAAMYGHLPRIVAEVIKQHTPATPTRRKANAVPT